MDNHNNTDSTLLKMAKLAYAVMKDKDTPFHLRREASEALIEFDVCDLIFTKEAKAGISALNGLMKLSATETPNTHLTFPDGSIRTFPAGVTGLDVAESISKTLAKRTVAVSLIGKIIAASDVLESGRIEIICSGDPRANVTEALNAAHKAVCAELRTRLGDGVMVLHELEPNSDAVKFVNALNEGKFSTATPAKPEAITAEQLRNEALNVVRQIANGRPPESSLQYDAALYLLEHAYRIAD